MENDHTSQIVADGQKNGCESEIVKSVKSVNPIKVKSLSKEAEEVKVKVENGHTSQIVVKSQMNKVSLNDTIE